MLSLDPLSALTLTALLGSLICSLVLWGLLRTAAWLCLYLAVPQLSLGLSLSFLSFFAAAAWLVSYRNGRWSWPETNKRNWIFCFIFVGLIPLVCLGGLWILIGPLVVTSYLLILKLLRFPVSQIVFLSHKWKWLPTFFLLQVLAIALFLKFFAQA